MTSALPASGAPFPYRSSRVCYFVIEDGKPAYLRYAAEKRTAFQAAADGGPPIYAVWPGSYRSDLFVIDNPSELPG